MSKDFEEALDVIKRLREEGALVHSITNTVAQNFTANVLLACGATPSMTVNPDEVEHFTGRSDCLHINLGTLDQERIAAIRTSVTIANNAKKPILLDPVMANISPLRAEMAKDLLPSISILRGNAVEISALDFEGEANCCVAQTGEQDLVSGPKAQYRVSNGHPIMAKLIATGCALGALIAALSTKSNNPESACLAGLIWFGVAGELAAEECKGPGSFAPAFLDQLHNCEIQTLRERATLS